MKIDIAQLWSIGMNESNFLSIDFISIYKLNFGVARGF